MGLAEVEVRGGEPGVKEERRWSWVSRGRGLRVRGGGPRIAGSRRVENVSGGRG